MKTLTEAFKRLTRVQYTVITFPTKTQVLSNDLLKTTRFKVQFDLVKVLSILIALHSGCLSELVQSLLKD